MVLLCGSRAAKDVFNVKLEPWKFMHLVSYHLFCTCCTMHPTHRYTACSSAYLLYLNENILQLLLLKVSCVTRLVDLTYKTLMYAETGGFQCVCYSIIVIPESHKCATMDYILFEYIKCSNAPCENTKNCVCCSRLHCLWALKIKQVEVLIHRNHPKRKIATIKTYCASVTYEKPPYIPLTAVFHT